MRVLAFGCPTPRLPLTTGATTAMSTDTGSTPFSDFSLVAPRDPDALDDDLRDDFVFDFRAIDDPGRRPALVHLAQRRAAVPRTRSRAPTGW